MTERWYDVQDEDGHWRVGQCFFQDKLGTKTIGFDGFHPNYTTVYCSHSNFVLPIRTKTFGLTVPDDKKVLRQVLTQLQLENISGRLNLYLMKPDYLQFEPKLIRSSIRTQFLIMVHKIFTTPFEVIRQIKMMDLEINKFFINVLVFYTRMIELSKSFMAILDTSPAAQQLYKSLYELTFMSNLIFGIHQDSAKLYDHKLNISLKSLGFIDFFVMSDNGILPFRNFFRGANQIKKPNQFDYQLSQIITNLILDLCQKSKAVLVDGPNQTKTILVLDDIISNFKHMAQTNEVLRGRINKNLSLVSKIQSLYFKLRPNKSCPLRKYLNKEEPKQQKTIQIKVQSPKLEKEKVIHDQEAKKLEERIKKLQQFVANQANTNINGHGKQQFKDADKFQKPQLPIQNLGEEMFLASLEWALETGDIQTAKKLTKWRKSLLQVGRITGWQVALYIGSKTYKKQQITAADIIEANYQYLSKLSKTN